MKTVSHPTLPLATTSPFTPWGRSGRKDPHGWKQAFVGAAKSYAGGVEGPTAAPGEAPRVASGGLPPHATATPVVSSGRAASSEPPARATTLAGPAARIARGAVMPDGHLQHDGAAAFATPVQAVSQGQRAKDGPVQTPRLPSQPPQRGGEANPPPIRVHVEHRAGGVAVWVGVDRSVSSECLHAVIDGLRSPMRGGAAVVSLTCNGVAVFSDSPNHKDIP